MGLSPVQQAKTYELVIERIRAAILDGSFPPGSRLPSVKSLSETLSVGQSAVREALSALRVTGLVEMRQGDGTFVAALDSRDIAGSIEQLATAANSDILALLELRISIEAGAGGYAAVRRQASHLKEMGLALNRMEQDLGNAAIGDEADFAFHYAIAKASHNPYMQLLMETISVRIQNALRKSREALFQISGEGELLLSQHREIYEAIEASDAPLASNRMQRHLEHVLSQLRKGGISS